MLKDYIKYKIKTREFQKNFKQISSELKDKKVLVCGNVAGFKYINKICNFDKIFKISAFVCTNNKKQRIHGIKTILPKQISKESFDCILITEENNPQVLKNILLEEICTDDMNIKTLFIESERDIALNLDFLFKYKFSERLKYLSKKLHGKKILFYGAGLFFNLINEHYDLSGLNAIGIADKYQSQLHKGEEICGYKLYSPDEITKLNPDYVIISTRKIISVANELYCNYIKGSKIKLITLVKRNIIRTIIEG